LDFCIDQLAQRDAAGWTRSDEILLMAQGVQPGKKDVVRALQIGGLPERSGGNRLDDGQHVLGAVLKFPDQDVLTRFGLLALRRRTSGYCRDNARGNVGIGGS
jgi:hypothetical protein